MDTIGFLGHPVEINVITPLISLVIHSCRFVFGCCSVWIHLNIRVFLGVGFPPRQLTPYRRDVNGRNGCVAEMTKYLLEPASNWLVIAWSIMCVCINIRTREKKSIFRFGLVPRHFCEPSLRVMHCESEQMYRPWFPFPCINVRTS